MKILKFLLVALTSIGLSSCLSGGGNTITQEFTPYCISYVTDMNTGASSTVTDVTYRLLNQVDDGLLTFEIGNLKLPNGTYVTLKLVDQRYSYSKEGAMILNVPVYESSVSGLVHSISNFKMEYYGRYLGQQTFPMLVLSYVVDNQYSVQVIYNPAYYWGTTTVTDQDGKVYVNEAQTSYYGVQFFPTDVKADCAAFNAKFAENMPAMSMTFKNLPYTFSPFGYDIRKDEITPIIGNTPYPSYKITDFVMTGSWGGTQTLQFTCTIDTEKVKGKYFVVATLGIMPPKPSTQQ